MDEVEKPEFLRVVKEEPIGLLTTKYYAADPNGNVWCSVMSNGRQSEWQLFKRAEEIVQPTLSVEQVLRMKAESS